MLKQMFNDIQKISIEKFSLALQSCLETGYLAKFNTFWLCLSPFTCLKDAQTQMISWNKIAFNYTLEMEKDCIFCAINA